MGGWWRLAAVDGWRLVAVGGWRLSVGGGWRLAVGGPLGRSLRAVLNKKKSGPLRIALAVPQHEHGGVPWSDAPRPSAQAWPGLRKPTRNTGSWSGMCLSTGYWDYVTHPPRGLVKPRDPELSHPHRAVGHPPTGAVPETRAWDGVSEEAYEPFRPRCRCCHCLQTCNAPVKHSRWHCQTPHTKPLLSDTAGGRGGKAPPPPPQQFG